jgi:two-component system, NtrC family, sensor kinase
MPKPAFIEQPKRLRSSRHWEGDEVLRVLAEVEHSHPEGSMALRAVRDDEGSIIDFEWIYANTAAERTLSWRVGGLTGRRLHEVPPELGLAGQFEAFHQVVETGESCQQVFPHSCDGFDGWLQATVARFRDGVLVRLRDITVARRAEAGLRETRDRLVELLENLPEGFLSVDAYWRYTYINRNALLLTGKPREKLFGRDMWSTSPELLGTIAEREYRRVMAERVSTVFELEFTPGRWFEVHAYPSGSGIAIFFRDSTEKKKAEQQRDELLEREHSGRLEAEELARQRARELLAAREKLVQSEKLAVAGQLAAGVGHEINNPLSFVMGNIHFALEQISSLPQVEVRKALEETAEALAEAREGAERIRGIVRDLKTFARADDSQLRPVDVHAALEFSLSMAMNHVRYRAKVVKCYGTSVPPVWANEAKLGQVFLNLIINAAQAIPEGDPAQHRIILTTYASDHHVVVEVTDTGKGMTPEVLSRAFEPFFTTKPQGEGTGLGLSICHGIIKALRGELTAASRPGKGSTFRVVLPLLGAEDKVHVPSLASVLDAPPVQGKRVLIIDDEPGIASVMRRIIGRGNEVVAVSSGREALALLARDADFDRIFCDLMMTDLTGMDVHGELARTNPECLPRLVFMTGGGFTTRARTFLQNFSHPRIDKPFEPELIRRLVFQSPPRV